MCSTPGQRIAAIGQAIDDLAAQARSAYSAAGRSAADGTAASRSAADGTAAGYSAADGSSAGRSMAEEAGRAARAAGNAATSAGQRDAHAAGTRALGDAEHDLQRRITAGQSVPPGEPARPADPIVLRVAELWAQLAELDPEVARRLPIYEA